MTSALAGIPTSGPFFLNEIEYGGTNYFARHLPFDCVPYWADRFAAKARELCLVDYQKESTVDGRLESREMLGPEFKRRRLSEPADSTNCLLEANASNALLGGA